MIAELLQRCRQGDRQALARLLSLAARGEGLAELDGLPSVPETSRVVALTGSAGVGKSSLVGRLIAAARQQGRKVAVLACDPQSPLSGGALLGDRFRMNAPADNGVFIRSLAAPGGQAALAEHVPYLLRLLASFGFDLLLLETVGAGQGDTAVRDLADVVVLLLQPETGDDLQWEKAGVLEVADVIVIHKKDLPGAEQTAAQVRSMLTLSHRPAPPVLLVSSKSGEGIAELYETMLNLPARRRSATRNQDDFVQLLQREVARRLQLALVQKNPEVTTLCQQWQAGTLATVEVLERILRSLVGVKTI